MRLAAAFTFLCGCNQIFGLEPTQAIPTNDAPYFDAPVDAPFACPPPGSFPTFSRLLHQIPEHCNGYESSTAAGVATAMCPAGLVAQISLGTLDGQFSPVGTFEQVGMDRLDQPRLAPDGDLLFVRNWNTSTLTARVKVYGLTSGTFTYSHDLQATFDTSVKFSHLTSGPVRHMLIQDGTSSSIIEYIVDASGALTMIHTYTPGELGLNGIYSIPSLSPDGLRVVFVGGTSSSSGTYYMSRAAIGDLFTSPMLIPEVPVNSDPFMTPDCGRLYFSALGYIFWVQRT